VYVHMRVWGVAGVQRNTIVRCNMTSVHQCPVRMYTRRQNYASSDVRETSLVGSMFKHALMAFVHLSIWPGTSAFHCLSV
jgi:hypothetical protein